MTRRAIVVDDHASFRRAASEMLSTIGCSVVGEAANGREALAVVGQTKPDFVLLDVQLPDIDGFEVLQRLTNAGTLPRVVLVSTRSEADYAQRLTNCGAAAFVSKADLSLAVLEDLMGNPP